MGFTGLLFKTDVIDKISKPKLRRKTVERSKVKWSYFTHGKALICGTLIIQLTFVLYCYLFRYDTTVHNCNVRYKFQIARDINLPYPIFPLSIFTNMK